VPRERVRVTVEGVRREEDGVVDCVWLAGRPSLGGLESELDDMLASFVEECCSLKGFFFTTRVGGNGAV
jgi:hypothetical protein